MVETDNNVEPLIDINQVGDGIPADDVADIGCNFNGRYCAWDRLLGSPHRSPAAYGHNMDCGFCQIWQLTGGYRDSMVTTDDGLEFRAYVDGVFVDLFPIVDGGVVRYDLPPDGL